MNTSQESLPLWRAPTTHSRFFKLRGFMGGLLLLPALILISFSHPIVEVDSPWDEVIESTGWIFLACYVTCRLWATLYVGGRKDMQLQTTGIYSVTRNPLYLGSTCFALSAACFFESPLVFGLTLALLAYYLVRVIPSEEAVLRDRFPETFAEYAKRTPKFFPRLTTYRPAGDVTVYMTPLKREARRLWGAALLPILGDLFEAIRTSPHWPHLFHWL